jgi:hypothetical protein
MRIELGKDQSEATVFTFRQKHIDPAVESKISAAKRLMGLKTGPQEFNVVYGSAPKDDAQIAVFSRSILEIIIELAPYMDVPQEDIEEGRSYPTLVDQMDVSAEFEPLITINSQMDKPLDAFIAVPFQGHWFWVDDRDFSSKRMFSFLLLLFSFLNRKNP